MNKNALDVPNVTTKVINNLSGNLAGGALLANHSMVIEICRDDR